MVNSYAYLEHSLSDIISNKNGGKKKPFCLRSQPLMERILKLLEYCITLIMKLTNVEKN